MTPRKLVLVEWEDSFGCPPGWHYSDEVAPAVTVVSSVGWLLKETREYLFLAPHINKAGTTERPQIAGYITIPIGAVKRRMVLSGRASSRRSRRAGLA